VDLESVLGSVVERVPAVRATTMYYRLIPPL